MCLFATESHTKIRFRKKRVFYEVNQVAKVKHASFKVGQQI